MKLSVIVATRNRAHAIIPCLDSIAAAFAAAAPLDAEIVVVDKWLHGQYRPAHRSMGERKHCPGAITIRTGRGQGPCPQFRLACRSRRAARVHRRRLPVALDLLRYDAADTGLVIRGGRIELGDPTDLPVTINVEPTRERWSRAINSARYNSMNGKINGCNMAMRRALVERIGPFDVDFGPGSRVGSGDDTEYIYRAYIANATLEHVPDMTVFHHHGRKSVDAARNLWRKYATGQGAIYAKYILRHPNLCRPFYWDARNAFREIVTGTNTFLPEFGFSHRDMVACATRGAIRYLLSSRKSPAIEGSVAGYG